MSAKMSLNLDNLPTNITEYNILLFGEIDAGKSIFIKALKSLKYSSFEEAKSDGSLQNIERTSDVPNVGCLSPSMFRQKSTEDKFGKQSSTRKPTNQKFCVKQQNNNRTIRLIDTPSIGGPKDSKNLEKTQQFIEKHRTSLKLHGICVLLRWDKTSNSEEFKNRIEKILLNLPKSALENVIFYFTFVENEIYKPSQNCLILKSYLHQKFGIALRLDVNCFYFDNESYMNSYENWNKMRSQIQMSLDQVAILNPVNIDLFVHQKQNCAILINFDEENESVDVTTGQNDPEFFKKLIEAIFEKNLLKYENKISEKSTRYDFTNAKLENVIFTCDNSDGNFGDVTLGNHNEVDFVLENIDHMIKNNLQEVHSIMMLRKSLVSPELANLIENGAMNLNGMNVNNDVIVVKHMSTYEEQFPVEPGKITHHSQDNNQDTSNEQSESGEEDYAPAETKPITGQASNHLETNENNPIDSNDDTDNDVSGVKQLCVMSIDEEHSPVESDKISACSHNIPGPSNVKSVSDEEDCTPIETNSPIIEQPSNNRNENSSVESDKISGCSYNIPGPSNTQSVSDEEDCTSTETNSPIVKQPSNNQNENEQMDLDEHEDDDPTQFLIPKNSNKKQQNKCCQKYCKCLLCCLSCFK